MRTLNERSYVVGSLILVAVLFGIAGSTLRVRGQVQQPGASPGLGTPMPGMGAEKLPEPDEAGAHARRVQEAAAMDERHKKMQTDTDKLLQLATDLKFEVDHSSKDETSVTAFLKADQIEKLAHDVKQRLKN